MLMRCEGCGRVFDYEKQDGICPGCGRFCTQPGPGGRNAGAESGPAANGWAGQSGAEAGSEQPARSNPGAAAWPVLFCLLAALWLAAMGGGFLLLRHRQATLPERAAFASPAADETSGGFLQGGRRVEITGAELLSGDYRAGLPEGGCLVRVGLRFGETGWRSGCGDLIYLQSGDCFYRAADSYSLGQVYPELAKNALEEDTLQYTEAGEGWLYFALPAPPQNAALYLEEAVGYGEERRVSGAAFCPLNFIPADMEGGGADA